MLRYIFFIGASFLLISTITVEAKPPQKLVGAEIVTYHEFPFIVSIRIFGRHLCGGSIISPWHILTAAHCIGALANVDLPKITVVTGSLSSTHGGEVHRVQGYRAHEGFNPSNKNLLNDIAIIKLAQPIVFNAVQNAIPIIPYTVPDGTPLTAIGWGYQSANTVDISEELRKLTVTSLDPRKCQKFIPTNQLWNRQICAMGSRGHGTCGGDSGGPLVYNGQIVGIVSYGIPCGIGVPDVYTSVYYYSDWIRANAV